MKKQKHTPSRIENTVITGDNRGKLHITRNKLIVIILIIIALILAGFGTVRLYRRAHAPTHETETPKNIVDQEITLDTKQLSQAKNDQEKINSLLMLAANYTQNKNYSAAVEAYQQIMTIKPDYLPAVLGLATLYYNTKDQPNAIEWINKAIELLSKTKNPDKNSIAIYQALLKNAQHNNFSALPDSVGADS